MGKSRQDFTFKYGLFELSRLCIQLGAVLAPMAMILVAPTAFSMPIQSKQVPAPQRHMDAALTHHYILQESSLGAGMQPEFERVEHHAIAGATLARFGSIASNKRDASQFERRAYTGTRTSVNVTSDSFIMMLTCAVPYGETTDSSSDPGVTCTSVASSARRALMRLERSIYIRTPIIIRAAYASFCNSNSNTSLGNTCPVPDETLGYASPTAWHAFNASIAATLGLDSNYLYPSSLAKQYVPENSAFSSGSVDISINLNSDVNWWFASSSDDMGRTDNGVWGNYNPIYGGAKLGSGSPKSYDIEQVTMHEITHGLGFISSWGQWVESGSFLPSFLDKTSNGTVIGLTLPYIYNRWMSDASNGIWMRTYADAIRAGVKAAIDSVGSTKWYASFNTTVSAEISRAIGAENGPFRIPGGLVAWYPSAASSSVGHGSRASRVWGDPDAYRYVFLHTPRTYSSGSSISHVSSTIYSGTSDYLMRSSGTLRAGIDAITPMDAQGPIGEATLGVLRSIGYVTK